MELKKTLRPNRAELLVIAQVPPRVVRRIEKFHAHKLAGQRCEWNRPSAETVCANAHF
jgi:hypothetical protein